jgi:hypothetical protein
MEEYVDPLQKRRSYFIIRKGVLLYKQLIPHDGLCVPRMDAPCPHPRPEATCVVAIQVSSRRYVCPCSFFVVKFMRIWVFHYSPTT